MPIIVNTNAVGAAAEAGHMGPAIFMMTSVLAMLIMMPLLYSDRLSFPVFASLSAAVPVLACVIAAFCGVSL